MELNSIERYHALAKSSAIFLGIALWDFTVALSVHLGRKMISQKWLKWLSVAAGISLIGFGISFGYRAFCQGRLFFPQNRRFKIPQKDLIDPSVFLVGAFFPAIDSFPPLG
ncbi:hypothetical protein C1N76_15090 [Geobacillus thermoleovorans]|uniref:Uncharacterized protein n=2 Tax=Geobacillus thermoleovorans TaxID=33941 RepID=A0A2Z3NBJ6_GEOTH|nr:hypothetical protein C1N76_15090 [Geobacillus thermoleovorans]